MMAIRIGELMAAEILKIERRMWRRWCADKVIAPAMAHRLDKLAALWSPEEFEHASEWLTAHMNNGVISRQEAMDLYLAITAVK